MQKLADLKNAIKTEAHRLGFTHFGVAPALPAPRFDDFRSWVEAGHHASMGYLSRPDTLAKRADPGLVLADCQRVISLAIPYHRPQTPPNEALPGYGRISAYALTRDYHEIIWEKLGELETFIQTRSENAQVKSYVDTGPILERSFAAWAGIGIPGKNSCLLIPGTGSYVFLAEGLTDLALPVDPPFTRDLCGACQRCIDACPTGCILPDRTIDASRCISYLTIENKDLIPTVLMPQVGDWFFGCDVCQMVCPHNTKKSTLPNPLGEARLPEFMDLLDLLTWDQAVLTAAFAGTALARAKRRGLMRNAAVVLGNQRCRDALPSLEALRDHETDPVIRETCHWAIDQIQAFKG
jgi:epoxyqueuosine reductase